MNSIMESRQPSWGLRIEKAPFSGLPVPTFVTSLFLKLMKTVMLLYFALTDREAVKKRTSSRPLRHNLDPSMMAMFAWGL